MFLKTYKIVQLSYVFHCVKCPISELIWSALPRIETEYVEILRISPYSDRMRESTDQNNTEYGHFLRKFYKISQWRNFTYNLK